MIKDWELLGDWTYLTDTTDWGNWFSFIHLQSLVISITSFINSMNPFQKGNIKHLHHIIIHLHL